MFKVIVIGIDFGICYICVVIYWNEKVEIIKNDIGNEFILSVVVFIDIGILVGELVVD